MLTKALKIIICFEYTIVLLLAGTLFFKIKKAKNIENTPQQINVESDLIEAPKDSLYPELTPPQQPTKEKTSIYDKVLTILDVNKASRTKINYSDATLIYNSIEYWTGYFGLPTSKVLGMAAQESKFNSKAYRKDTKATGIFQITPIALKDFNLYSNKNYSMDDMYDIEKNVEVGCWTYNRQIHYMNNLGIDWTHDDVVIAFNSGIGNFKNNINSYRESYDYLDKVNAYEVAFK